jgi:glutamate/aspartate transport system permease protein
MAFEWQWQVFCKSTLEDTVYPHCLGSAGDITYLDWLLSAWGWTAAVSAGAWVLALGIGALIGTLRTLPHRGLAALGTVWVELFRNIPLLVQIFLWYHVIPALLPPLKGFPPFLLVVLGLGFFTSARVAEHVRAGIQSLPRGQGMAAQALGLTQGQTYRHVILPMALRVVLPPLTSEAMGLVKNSSVAFAVSIAELTLFALQAQEETTRGIEVYLAVTGLYVVTSMLVNRVFAFIEGRVRVPGYLGAAR